mmetsp:Transcript_21027/g.33247  ORF Transcript_21027/g.33247 Transcript_21027/m.33247 type:complete len:280 (+) Transcript_21027:561-1400(+)
MPPPKQLASSLPKGGRANPRGSSTPLDRAPRLGQIRGDSRRNCSSNRQPSAGITGTFLENFQQRSGRQPHPSRSGCGSGYRSGGTWWPLSWRPPQVPWRPAVPLIAGSVGTSSLPPPPPPLPPLPRLCSPWRRKAAAAAALQQPRGQELGVPDFNVPEVLFPVKETGHGLDWLVVQEITDVKFSKTQIDFHCGDIQHVLVKVKSVNKTWLQSEFSQILRPRKKPLPLFRCESALHSKRPSQQFCILTEGPVQGALGARPLDEHGLRGSQQRAQQRRERA